LDVAAVHAVTSKGGWLTTRMLWGTVAVLMILTPLGLLAAGVAWGEWSAEDFANPDMRQQMMEASGNQPPPEQTPAGLERLASLWTAPLPDYAPAFIRSPAVGYIFSAMVGTGLIILFFLGVGWLTDKVRGPTTTTG
jgi:cobalt/nickel transport system permease protein